MKRAILISALFCAVAVAAPTVPDLVKQLETGGWAERESAENALAGMGEAAREPIRVALQSTQDPEVRERLISALSRIDRNQLLQTTPVTLKGTFERPYDAFAKVVERMGLKLQTESDAAMARATEPAKLDLSLEDVSWMVALSELTARTKIDFRIADGAIVLLEQPPSVVRKPMHVAGAMTVVAESARKRQMQQFFNDQVTGTTTLTLSLQCEPKMRFAHNRLTVKLDSLLDENGNAVLPDLQRDLNASGGSGGQVQVTLQLGAGDKLPPKLAKIIGDIEGDLVVRTSEVRVDDLSTLPETVEVLENRIEVLSMAREGDTWIIQMKSPTIFRGSGTMGGRPSVPSGLTIQDAEGRTLRYTTQPHRANTDNTIASLQVFPAADDEPPVRMIWTVPAQTREVRIPFELQNLEMPR